MSCFQGEVEFSVVGPNEMHLAGNMLDNDEDDDMMMGGDDDDEDEEGDEDEDEDEEGDEDEEEAPPQKSGKKAIKQGTKIKEEEEDMDEDDDDDDEDDEEEGAYVLASLFAAWHTCVSSRSQHACLRAPKDLAAMLCVEEEEPEKGLAGGCQAHLPLRQATMRTMRRAMKMTRRRTTTTRKRKRRSRRLWVKNAEHLRARSRRKVPKSRKKLPRNRLQARRKPPAARPR